MLNRAPAAGYEAAMNRHALRRTALALVLVLPGCFGYAAAPAPVAVPSGADVRFHLEPVRSFDVSGYTAHGIGQVEGTLVQRDGDAWQVAARTLLATGGDRFRAHGFAVTIPEEAVTRVEVRRLSPWRTAAASLIAAVGAFVASELLQGTSSTGNQDPPGLPGPRAVIPLP